MAAISIQDDALRIELSVPERVLSLHGGTVTIPLRQITKAVAVSDAMSQVRGTKMPGARVPGLLAIGTWHGDQAGRSFHDFVAVHRPGPGVVLTLRGGEYDRIVLDTPKPQRLLDQLA